MSTARFDPRVRLFVNDTWADVTDRLRQDPTIVITTGRKDRSKTPDAGTCTLTFDNEDGAFSPRNPTSPFVGSLNRYTPIVVLLDEVVDAFGRVVASGWSTTDTGETYATKSVGGTISGTDYSVDGQSGKHLVPAASAYRMSHLGAASGAPRFYNGEVLTNWTLPFTDVTGGAVEPGNLALRMQSDTQYYLVRVTVETDETVKVRLMVDGSTTIAGPVTVAGITHAAGQRVWVLGGVYDDTIYASVWTGTLADRPDEWLIEADDTTYGYGYYGVRTGAASGNTNVPVTCSYGDLVVYPSQFNGEVAEWPQDFSADGRDMVAPIEAGGVLRRLSDNDDDLDSTLHRYYTKVADPLPDYYWPVSGGTESTGGLAAIGTRDLILYSGTDSPPFFAINPKSIFGNADMASWLPKGASLGGLAQITNQDFSSASGALKALLQLPVTDYLAFDFVRAGGVDTVDTVGVFNLLSGPSQGFEIKFDEAADTIVFEWTVSNTVVVTSTVTASTLTTNVFDGGPHHVRVDVVDTAGTRAWAVRVDDSTAANGTTSTALPPFLDVINAQALMPIDKVPRVGFTSLALFTDSNAPLTLTSAVAAMRGHSGEYLDVRVIRIFDEEDIRHFMPGASSFTKVGPQFQESLVGILDELVRTDGGMYRELLSARALHYDTRGSLINVPVTATIDVGAHEMLPPFRPVDDDKDLVNTVKADKREGGSVVYEVTAGRLGSLDPKLGGAGRKRRDVHANPHSDDQLLGIAQLATAVGTLDQARYPSVRLSLRAPEIENNLPLRRAILNAYVSSRVRLTNMSEWHQVEDADLMVIGMQRLITPYRLEVDWSCAPYAPNEVFRLNSTDRLGGTSTLTAELAAGATGTFQATAAGVSIWATAGGYFPMDVHIGGEQGIPGERVTLSGISGAGATQTFTISARGVNGFTKTWPTGSSVRPVSTAVLG